MKTKIILFATMAVAAMTACSSDDDNKVANDERIPIQLSVNADEAVTRAGQGIQNTQFDVKEKVDVQITSVNSMTSYDMLTYFVSDTEGTLQPTKGVFPYYPLDKTNVNIRAIYPSGYMNASSFSVKTSQKLKADYMASDLMYADTAGVAPSNNAVELKFKHKMAKIQVNLTKKGGVNLRNSTVKILNVLTQTTFEPLGGIVTIAGATGSRTDVTITDNGYINSACIIVPQTVPSGYLLEIALANNDVLHYKTVQDMTFESGKVYTFNVDVVESNITVSTTVSPWDADSNGDGQVNTSDDVEERVKLASN